MSERTFEAKPLDWIQGRIRKRALLTTSCRFLCRSFSCQPMNCSRAASSQALALKLNKATRRSPVKTK